jgi:peptide/nickel transport system permease protein
VTAPRPLPAASSPWTIVGRQFRKRRTAVWGLRVTVALVLLAVFAPFVCSAVPLAWIEPGETLPSFPVVAHLYDENTWEHALDRAFNLLIPGLVAYGIGALLVRAVVGRGDPERAALRRATLRRLRTGVGGLVLLALLLQALGVAFVYRAPREEWPGRVAEARALAAAEDPAAPSVLMAPVPYGYRDQRLGLEHRYRGAFDFEAGRVHLLGTDELGRDVFARIVYGTRISLTIGLVSVLIYASIGTILGALAGYFGRRVDAVVMRVVEVMISVPSFFLLLVIIALFESRTIFMIMAAIGLVSWTGITRLVRGEFLRERAKDYVPAARSLGIPAWRIAFRHILPNSMGPVLVAMSFGVPGAIVTETTLAFLGLGDITVPSWGKILNDGRVSTYWHMIVPPSVAIFLTVTAMNLVGDGLRDALDPKLRS